ncbi:hypothetical protein J1N35_011265 [Gossypium stocksii]|uniref:Uncharacterized protein n=1 Tax=Gossypium stocksii TaxID=47602 RepID=A0A9D3W2F6_9ROSI|nr:hypothetical protein J1N35_011265 [Gossypium stocksii]
MCERVGGNGADDLDSGSLFFELYAEFSRPDQDPRTLTFAYVRDARTEEHADSPMI